MEIAGIDFSNVGDWTAGDWAEALLKGGLTWWQLENAGVDVPTSAEFLQEVTDLYNDTTFRSQIESASKWQSEQQDNLQLASNRRMMERGMENVMGSDYDPNKSIAQNIIDADKIYNPEMYAAKDAIMGTEYGGLGRLGTYYGESIHNENAAGKKMESMALDMLGLNGALSSRDIRDVNEMARAGFNDRGRVRDTSAVIQEVLDNEAARRARRDEARAFATDSADINNQLAMDNANRQDRMTQYNIGTAFNTDLKNIDLDNIDYQNRLNLGMTKYNTAVNSRVDPLSNTGVYTQNPNAQSGLLTVGNTTSIAGDLTGSRILADDEKAGRRANTYWNLIGQG